MFNKSVPMKKRTLIPINRILGSLFVLFFTYQISYSQCAVPTNVDISVVKCSSDFPKVKELSASKTSTSSIIEWFLSETDGSALDPDQLLETAIYWVQQTIDDCTSNRVSTSVAIYSPDIPNIDANQTICHTSTQTIADLKPINNNILWYESDYIEGSEDLGTPLSSTTPLINGKTYWAAQYNFPCETILRISTTIQLEKAPNAGIGTSFTSCEIYLAVSTNLFLLLSNNPDSNGSWTNPNGAPHSGLFVPGNLNGTYTYTVSSNSGFCQDVISEIIVTISSPSPPTINETTQGFCESQNATIADLTPNNPNIKWYDSSNTILASSTLLINDEVYSASKTEIIGSNSCESIHKTDVTVIIYKPESPIINNPTQFFCESQDASISDLIPNTSTINWYDSEGNMLNSNTLLEDGKIYSASQNIEFGSNMCESIDKTDVTVTIYSPLPPVITETTQSFCESQNATIKDLIPNGSGINWYDSDGNILNSNTLLENGKTYLASQTIVSNSITCESITKSNVTVLINNPSPPIISETIQSFCESQNATIEDLIPNGSDINWYDFEGNILDLSILLEDGKVYSATKTEEFNTTICESVTKTNVTIIINKPQAPVISQTTQSFCENQMATIANLIPNDSNILWYDENGNLLASETFLSSGIYSASKIEDFNTYNCESSNRTSITVTILKAQTPIINETTQFFCEDQMATIGHLIPNGSDIIWYDFEGNILELSILLEDGKVYSATKTEEFNTTICESLTKTDVTVIISKPQSPVIDQTTRVFCESEFATISDLNANNTNLTWYNNEGNILTLETLLENGIYFVSKTEEYENSTCESLTKTEVNVTIYSPQPPNNIETSQSFCKIQNATVSDLSPNDETIIWYDSNNNLLAPTTLLTNGSYHCSKLENFELATCESINKTTINVSIIEMQNPTASSNQVFCLSNQPTVNDLEAEGTNILWFKNENDPISLALNSNQELENNKTYWAVDFNEENGCKSPLRIRVFVLINDVPSPTTSNNSQTFCSLDKPSLKDLDINESTILWYDSIISNVPLDQELLLENQKTYYASQINDVTNCESSSRLAINVTLINVESPSILDLGNKFCKVNQPTLSDLNSKVTVSTNEEVKWFSSFPNGLPLSLNERLIEGKTYYAISTNLAGCQSSFPLEVTITLESCDDFDIKLYDGFSPNENGKNDYFTIGNLKELYPNFKVEFYNRWGKKVFTSNASNPSWNGRLNGNGKLSPTGVYYYIIYFNKDHKKPIQQRLYLSR